MKNACSYLALLAMTLLCAPSFAQTGALKKGDKFYENMVYPQATRQYEKGLKKTQDLRSMERLADAYEQLSNLDMAERWYAKVVTLKGTAPANLMHYGMVLKANGNYAEARKWFNAYAQTNENPAAAARMLESCDYAAAARLDSSRYQVAPEPCNTAGSEFAPVRYKQGYLMVAEARTAGRRMVNMRNNNNFYDLFYVERDRNSKSGVKATRLQGQVNRKYHDGPATLTRDQSTLYFTRSSYVKDQKGRSPMQRSKLKIYSATYSRGKWTKVTSLPFNSENYSCGHPALSADGNTMVFASDIPGGFGGTDLYVCHKEGNAWGTPENLGSGVNTDGEEQFPFLHPNGSLFFASTGHPGFGGFDLFAAGMEGDRWGKATNCGYGLNSAKDDFSILWNPNKASGYFASDRDGDDNIYSFKRQMRIEGTIVDRGTGRPVAGAAVTVLDGSSKEAQVTTDAEGRFSLVTEWGKEYMVTATKSQYLELRERVTTTEVGPHEDMRKTFTMEQDLVLAILGQVTDATTKQPLGGVSVRVIADRELLATSDAQGNYTMRLDANRDYAVVLRKPGYVPQILHCSTEGKLRSEDFKYDVALKPGSAVLIEGRTVVNETQAPLGGVNVRAVSMHTQEEYDRSLSRADGRFWQVVMADDEPTLIAAKNGYFASRGELPGIDSTAKDTVIAVTIGMVPYEVGALVKVIYYDYNKSDIKKIATKDLWEIIYFMQDNPEASVELSSHTDSRGGATYNAELSQRRADAAVSYIISKRIERGRLTSKGYGESALVNKCTDDMPCTDEEHGKNRRTEIRITKLN